MFKKAKVVILPTNQKAHFGDIILSPLTKQLLIFQHQNCTEVAQHLYITSDEEIKEGDWYYNTVRKEITKCENKIEEESNKLFPQYAKKIIAITDTSLGLPQPSQQFIEKYIEEYNKGNVITDVLVEYEEYKISKTEWFQEAPYICKYDDVRIKINHKDNTITIKKVKDSWNREEIVGLCKKSFDKGLKAESFQLDMDFNFYNWIEQNL